MTIRFSSMLGVSTVLVLAACLLALPNPSGAADDKGAPAAIPDKELTQLNQQNAKIIQDSLSGAPDKKAARKAEVAAVMIAAASQRGMAGASSPQQAAERDAALKLASAIKSEDFATARKEAGALAKVAPNPGAKTQAVPLVEDVIKLEDVMSQFSTPKSGGLGIEKQLEDLEESKNLTKAQLNDDLLLAADRAALVAEIVEKHDPGSKQKEWKKYANDMRKRALELATAVRKGDAKAASEGVGNLNKSCTACHDVFK